MRQYTPHWWPKLGLLDIRCLRRLVTCLCFYQKYESLQRSMMWLRQIAQLSTTISHAHKATAFHCNDISLALAASLLRIYLLDLKSLLPICTTCLCHSLRFASSFFYWSRSARWSIGHIDVCHSESSYIFVVGVPKDTLGAVWSLVWRGNSESLS